MSNGKICFVHLMNICFAPYLKTYIELLEEKKYDIIYWDRIGDRSQLGADHAYIMQYHIGTKDGNKFRKMRGYLRFRHFVSTILRSEDYDKIVCLSGNCAVLLNRILLKKYPGKYIVDIRDYFLENLKPYYNMEKKIIERASLAIISSRGYMSFLPPYDYTIVHNSQSISKTDVMACRSRKRLNHPLVISFIGGIRFMEQNMKIIDCFMNDPRFEIRFIGSGSEHLEKYCKQVNAKNVILFGYFPPEETLNYYIETDILMNLYGSGTPLLDYALSNKLYYAAQLGIPILVCPNTYIEEISIKYGFGFSFDLKDSTAKNRLYKYYHSIDWEKFYAGCDAFMETVRHDQEIFKRRVSKILKEN